MKTEAKKAADTRWDRENMRVLKVKVRREKAEAFSALCEANGTTRHAVLRDAVDAYLEKYSASGV